jgi:AcrR family transcriptional regulator
MTYAASRGISSTGSAMEMTSTEMKPAARERLLEAVLDELGRRGPAATDLSEALSTSGVSQEDFEAEYGDVHTCLLAAYDHFARRLDDAIRAQCRAAERRGAGWPEQVRHGLEALLGELAANPYIAQALIKGFPATSAAAQERHQAFVEGFSPLLIDGRRCADAGAELPREVENLAVGSAEAIIFAEVEADRTAQLSQMTPAVLFSLLVPFLGPKRAAVEAENAAR